MDKKIWLDKEALRAAMKPTLQLEALHAAMKPTLQMEVIQAAMKPTLQLEALHAAMRPTLPLEAIQAAMKPTLHLEALHAAMRPTLPLEAIQAAMKPTLQLEVLHAAMRPTLQMDAIQAAMKPALHLEALHAAMRPTMQMEAIQAAMKPTLQLEALHAAMRPTLPLEALHAAMKPTLQMEAIQAAVSTFPTMAALNAALRPGGSAGAILESFSAMVALGASLAAMGSLTPTPNVNWQTFSPNIAQAVSTAASIFYEDNAKQNQLTDIISRFQNPANDKEFSEQGRAKGNEIGQELTTAVISGDLSLLSDKAKKHLITLFWLISAFLSAVALEGAVRTEACQWQPTIWPGMTSGQKGKAIRKAACDVPTEVLKDHRYVHGVGVRLRAAPSTKGEILPVVLYDGDFLEVLSTKNRDWLKVSIVGHREVEGWVSRRYVKAVIQ